MEIKAAGKCAILLLASLAMTGAGARDVVPPQQEAIEGILVNQTITVAGQEFAASFAAMWADKPGVSDYALALRERPSAGRGTLVEVEHAGTPLFRAYLPPARAQVRALAAQAAEAAFQAALASQVSRLLPGDGDLGPDEI